MHATLCKRFGTQEGPELVKTPGSGSCPRRSGEGLGQMQVFSKWEHVSSFQTPAELGILSIFKFFIVSDMIFNTGFRNYSDV